MKLIRTEDAVGQVLCHDITQIIPGVVKDAVFRKGHIVTREDIPVLLSVGKERLYVWEKKEGILHEDEGAAILRDICINENMSASEPKEGKIEIKAQIDGLLKVRTEQLNRVNALGEMMIATIHGNFPVRKGDKIAATRIIPLVIEEEKMNRAREAAGEQPLLEILPFAKMKAGIVTTGSEVFKGRIQDAFGPAIRAKLEEYAVEVVGQKIVDDKQEDIVAAIQSYLDMDVDLVLCTGGMSVDPDDRTPGAIKAVGADIVSYGAPVLPGAMFLISYYNTVNNKIIPVLGLPGCVMYAKRTVFDLVLPRILAGESVISPIVVLGNNVKGKIVMAGFTHFDQNGNAIMVDVTAKADTERIAVATGYIQVNEEVYDAIQNQTAKKGDVLGTARIAGIMAAKKTSDLIPMCHPLMLTKVTVDFEMKEEDHTIHCYCTAKLCGKTGVEMEALTGVNVALLTIYDMCKAMDRSMEMSGIHLVEKMGGKSGHFINRK